jgi:RNA polymerase sigma factor (sigma-70 family)
MSFRTSSRRVEAMPDGRLVEMVRDGGHPRAFEALVQRYSQELTRYCRRMGLSDSRAEDVLQHAFLRAWMALEAGTEVRELRPWLYRIVHNTAVNVMRSSPDILSPLDEAEGIDAAGSGVSDFERRLAVRSALSGVAALPAMQRDAILMSAVDGRSHEEVASALGVTDGAVRGLLYRARATLRAAAAAFTPAPLIGWVSTRLAPAADRVVSLTAQGGTAELGGTLFKGAAVAVTAAVLVAGATQVPFHSAHARHHAPGASTTTATTAAAARVAAAGGVAADAQGAAGTPAAGTTAQTVAQGAAPSTQGQSTSTAPRPGPSRGTTRTASGHKPQEGPTTAAPPLTAAVSPSAGPSHAADTGSSPEPVKGPTGSESPGEKSGSGTESKPPAEGTTEKERELKETEAEKTRELKEREAEAARETKEREAELLREQKEREAEASNKGT